MKDRFVETNGIKLHYVDHEGDDPTIILLPGLTANAHSFDGLINAGLSPAFQVLALDLRGRGSSDKPETGYSMADHAGDVIGLLDALEIDQAVVGGHSFGGLLALYLAARYPSRVSKLIVLDSSAAIMNPTSFELIRPSLARLGRSFDSWAAYIAEMKAAPYFHSWWDDMIESYYRADVIENADGSVIQRSRKENIEEAMSKGGSEKWMELAASIRQPAVLIRAPEGFGLPGSPPIVPENHARMTAAAMQNCRYHEVPGNHMTMLFGEGAQQTVECIAAFLRSE